MVRDRAELATSPGATVSLLAWHGDATGVTTSGLRWPLHDAVLPAGSAIGTSNEAVATEIVVSVTGGVVAVVVPGGSLNLEEGR